ncbi:hypothetical protein [Cryobacterium sp. Y11]|uniref:hypothetical protein n=1 Tax=Cryobacterium sp. Y11 TaxID=2045016 RepID=UPI0011B096BC|nr:hypothetical protein [Cryobacterium sp. Y11]
MIDFTVVGLTPAPPSEATLTVVIPADFTIWTTARILSLPSQCVDPLIAYWDLAHSGGPDANEAADMILRKIRSAWDA